MEAKVCINCGRLFNYVGFGTCLCQLCKNIERTEILQIKDCLKEHPEANAKEVSTETGIPLRRIMEYLKDGVLEFKNNEFSSNCRNCGKIIGLNEKYCKECSANLINSFNKEFCIKKPQKLNDNVMSNPINKMRFIDKNKNKNKNNNK